MPDNFDGAKAIDLARVGRVHLHVETSDGRLIQVSGADQPHRLWQVTHKEVPANAFLIPFDQNFSARIKAVQRLHQRLIGKSRSATLPNPPLSRARRARLVLFLRALDGKKAGTSHREIAAVVLDPRARNIPAIEWTNAALRKRINRIIASAQAMTNGGYLKLIRGDVERARRFRSSE